MLFTGGSSFTLQSAARNGLARCQALQKSKRVEQSQIMKRFELHLHKFSMNSSRRNAKKKTLSDDITIIKGNFYEVKSKIFVDFLSKLREEMGEEFLQSRTKRHANFRLCNVSSFTTELLEICADEPAFHVLFIPGNPGVVTFYIDFVESLYELLGGHGSVTVVGYISHTMQNWEQGMVFTLQEQIDHKAVFIEQELTKDKVPIILVGHSIGAYASIEILKRIPEKVFYCIGLYPFLAVNPESRDQFIIDKISRSSTISVALSALVGLSGLLPNYVKRFFVSKAIGKKYSNNAVEIVCSHLAQYHMMLNIFFLVHTEFEKLAETPDWAFMREQQDKIAFLFGEDDHWGPLQMCEEISRQVPGIVVSLEREGHGHCFCGSTDGSTWVARHVAALINKQLSRSSL